MYGTMAPAKLFLGLTAFRRELCSRHGAPESALEQHGESP
jgi:hypothetical protein